MTPQRLVLSSALTGVLALGLVAPAAAADKEKCYGIAKAGQNDCSNLSGSHSCAGQSTAETSPDEWKYVAKGTCKDLKGYSADEAKKLIAKK